MTREELINHIKYNLEINADVFLTDEDARMVIEALEQGSILDKITEIIEPLRHLSIDEMSGIEWQILQLIDKYKDKVRDKVIEDATKSSVYEDKAERKTHSLVFDNEHEYQKFKNVLDAGWEPNF